MATDLAKQLERLKVPGQPSIREAVAKKKPSLLFEGKEAADIDVDTIYSLGTNGLEELIALEPSFADFQDSLFSESCKTFERTVQTREVVEQLDSTLAHFLRKLSSYLLLKPAHKCLEWLIRAYRIHSCNTDHLMECVLPYYETKLFARVVQLIPLKQQPSWQWLKPIQKEGTPLSRLTLVQHCVSNPAFLSSVCAMVPSSVRANKSSLSPGSTRVVTSFYCSTVVSVLSQTKVTESLVSRLLPYVLKGLKSSWTDYRAASYIIVSVLASRTTLDVKLTLSLLDVIIKHFGPGLSDEAVSCMIVLCYNAPDLDRLSNKAAGRVINSDSFVVSLERVSRSCDSSSLVRPLLLSLLDHLCDGEGEESGRVILQVLDSVPLSQSTASQVIKSLLHCYSQCGDDGDQNVLALIKQIARSLDSKYSCSMDQVLLAAMAVSDEERVNVIDRIQGFVDLALPGSRHKFAADGNTSLVLTLHHPDAHVRVGALHRLQSLLAPSSPGGAVTIAERDRDFISSAIQARLRDDDPLVVKAALDLGPEILLCDCVNEAVVDIVIDLISRKHLTRGSIDWQQCVHKAVAVVSSDYACQHLSDRMDTIITKLVGLVILGYHGNDSCGLVTSEIAHSGLGRLHPLLDGLIGLVDSDVWQSASSLASRKSPQLLTDASVAVVTYLGQRLANMEESQAINMVDKMVSKLSPSVATAGVQDKITRLTTLAVLTVTMTTSSHTLQLHVVQQLLNYVFEYLTHLNLEEKKGQQLVGWEGVTDTPTLSAVLAPLMGKHLKDVVTQSHTHLLLWLLHSIIHCIPINNTSGMWLPPPSCISNSSDSNSDYHSVLLYLFTLLSEWSGNDQHFTAFNAVSRNLMEAMIKTHFYDKGSLLRFLAMIWTCSSVSGADHTHCTWSHSHTIITEVVQVRALRLCSAYLRAMDHVTMAALVGAHCPIIPSLLLPLGSSVRELRKAAFRCLAVIHDVATSQVSSGQQFLLLVEAIVTNKISLIADSLGLQQLLGNLFNGQDHEKSETPGGGARKKTPRKRGKQVLMESALDSIIVHIVEMEAPLHIQSQLLQLLSQVDNKRKLLGVSPLLDQLISRCSQPSSSIMETNEDVSTPPSLSDLEDRTLQKLVHCFTASTAQWLASEPDLLKLFLSLLPLTTPVTPSCPSPAALALTQITGAFFTSLSSCDLQQLILQSIVDLMMYSRGSKVVAKAKDCIGNLPLTPAMVTKELMRHQDRLQGVVPATPSKRTRKSTRKQPSQETADDVSGLLGVHTHVYDNEGSDVGGVSLPWRRVSLVLEVVQNKCGDMQDSQQLVSHLFSLLSWCLEVDDKLMSSFEYIQQLILTSLLNICTTWGLHNTRAIPAANFNVELIVKCVRISTNPHTHQTALLLLSSAAAVFPTHILHNVMPIFTFMGASLLRRDDQYSLHVIKKTVDIIIPALIKSGSMKRSSTLLSTVTDIIRVFVDAVPHVPHHRRLPLFSHLLSTIGPQDYLYIALGLLVEKHVVLPTGKELASDEAHLDGKFMAALSREHGPLVQLLSCLKLLEYLRNLPEDKPENARKARQLPASVTLLFNIALHSQKQLRQFKYSLVSLVNTVLSGLSYPDIQRSQDMKDEDKKQLIMRIFREALYYTTSLSQSQTHSSDEATNRFWQAMLKRTCDTIDGVTSLLTLDPFLSIVYQLLVETEGDVQKKSLSMLNTKLESLKNRHLNSQVDATLLEVVDVVMGVALTESVAMTTRQNALYSLKLLIQRLASQHNDKFIKVTGSLLDILEQHSELVCSDGLLCIAELCLALVARVIPLLPRILACFMTYCGQVTDGKEQLHISALSSLCVVVETLPQFLSSTLPDMVVKSCHSHLVNNNCTQLTQQASKLRKLLANQIPARVFLPAIVKCYNALWDSSKSSVMALVDMLSVSIERLTREEVRSHSQIMVDTFLVMLDYRSVKQGVELTSILEVEKSVINSLACLVIKLSEASFRPIFLKLLDWSTHLDSHRKRAITFYHLTNIIAEKLKSLFLLFAGHLVQNAAELLDACNDSKQDELYFEDQIDHSDEERTEMTTLLLRFILDTLHKCLLYDKGSFLTKNNFKTLLKPLVDQVSNHHGGDACYQDRVSHQLVACVSQLAVAAGKDTLWKQLNNELLLITRHSKPEVKIAVLKIVREIYSKLGEEFTVLLPETIPFLAELMEDESLDVEKQAHTVIVLIEEIVGESVQQYF